jgi:hypothetical protein
MSENTATSGPPAGDPPPPAADASDPGSVPAAQSGPPANAETANAETANPGAASPAAGELPATETASLSATEATSGQAPARNPQLAAIDAELEDRFCEALDCQRQAVHLRHQRLDILVGLHALPSDADRVRANDEADHLMRQANEFEARIPGLFEGIAAKMIEQIKAMSEQRE